MINQENQNNKNEQKAKQKREYIGQLMYYSSLGFTVALSIVIGLCFGLFLSKSFGLGPLGIIIGIMLGIAAGFRNILLALKKSEKL